MAEIVKIDLTDVSDTLTNNILQGFALTNPGDIDSAAPKLESGRSEEIGGQLYQVRDGDLVVSGSPSDGTAFVYIEDTGSGVTATMSNTVPSWTGQGFYNGNAKAVFSCSVSSGSYGGKQRILNNHSLNIRGSLTLDETLIANSTAVVEGSTILKAGVNVTTGNITAATGDITATAGIITAGSKVVSTNENDFSSSKYIMVAGEYYILAETNEVLFTATGYTKIRESLSGGTGTIRVKFNIKSEISTNIAYGRIYINGSAVGTERTNNTTTYVSYTEDINCVKGDLIQLYIKNGTLGTKTYNSLYGIGIDNFNGFTKVI
jgi:hypothetical protein